jgi:nucleotide-binding universal stress UspA family protein
MAGILLATDGSDYAKEAEDRAIELARQHGEPLHVLCVVDRREFSESALSSGQLACIKAEDEGYECVTEVASRASDLGVEVESETCHGIPEDDIVEYAQRIDANLIVMGRHGDHKNHLGGVGRKVKRRSNRETLVV